MRWGVQYSTDTEYTHYFLISNCSNATGYKKPPEIREAGEFRSDIFSGD